MDSGEEYFSSSDDGQGGGDGLRVGDKRVHKLLLSQRTNNMLGQESAGTAGTGKVLFQFNSEELHRQELGGVVVYDSFARIIGNQHLTSYYEKNPPKRTDFTMLFSAEEQAYTDKLFWKEPRERDFVTEFDKFLFKNLPKFAPQREYSVMQSKGGEVVGHASHQYTISVPQQENILIFESRFESGNLRRAIKVNNVEYNLWLENDVNTKGHTQWFYFKVIHRYPKRQKIQFNILNLAKPQSLYSLGMKICILSSYHKKQSGKDWFRGGEDIKYFQNDIPRKAANHHGMGNNQVLYSNSGAGEGLQCYFTLSFTYEFEEDEDEVWFAQAVPYTFSDLQTDLIGYQERNKEILSCNVLCKDLTGSPCPLVTLTDNNSTYQDYYEQIQLAKHLPNVVRKQLHKRYAKAKKLYRQSLESKGKVRKLLRAAFEEECNSFYENNADLFKSIDDTHNTVGNGALYGRRYDQYNTKMKQYIMDHYHKKAIIITCRVHPGEPQSSHMLQGILDYLVSEEGTELRKSFVFRIVPMLNIDGVVYGNQRCSLLGVDLNRRWVSPNVFLHPTIFYAKQLVRNTHNERRVLMFFDLHGHSRKQNTFFYACNFKNYEHEGRIKNAQLRMLPLLCCKKAPDFFKFSDCRFRIEKVKESTARVVVFREFNIVNAFTMEVSFFGKEPEAPPESPELTEDQLQMQALFTKPKPGTQFTVKDLQQIGHTVAQTLNNYLPREQSKLELLSAKILEIFYDEFVKFIPPYILRREEERKRLGLCQETPIPSGQGAGHSSLKLDTSLQPSGPYQFAKSPTGAGGSKIQINNSPRLSTNDLANDAQGAADSGQPQNPLLKLSSGVRKHPRSSINTQNLTQIPTVVVADSTSQPLRKFVRISTTNQIAGQQPQQYSANQQILPVAGIIKRSSVAPQASSALQAIQPTAAAKKQPPRKRETSKPVTENTTNNPGTGTETETFSSIININKNQEEILDFELFIKVENAKLKQCDQNESEDDEMGGGSDSSGDSDESSKNLLVEQTMQRQNFASKLSTQRKPGVKKPAPKRQKEEEEVFKSMDGGPSLTSTKNQTNKQRRQNAAASMLAPRSLYPPMDSFKFKGQQPKPVLDSRQNFRIVNKTQSKNSRDSLFLGELQMFDRIPHRQSKSPKAHQQAATIEVEEENLDLDEDDEKIVTLGANHDQAQEEEKVINSINLQTPFIFKTFEDQQKLLHDSSLSHPQQHVLPLYENPVYHQNRLSSLENRSANVTSSHANPASILYNNMKANPFSFRGQTTQHRVGGALHPYYEPYNDEVLRYNRNIGGVTQTRTALSNPQTIKNAKQITSSRPSTQQDMGTPHKIGAFSVNITKTAQKASGGNNLMLQPILAQEIEQLTKKLKAQVKQPKSSVTKPSQQTINHGQKPIVAQIQDTMILSEEINQMPVGSTNISGERLQINDNASVQRISFKELLESSRQHRVQGVSADTTSNRATTTTGYKMGKSNGGLVTMLKNTYQRIQQQHSQNEGGAHQSANIPMPAAQNPNFSQILSITDEAGGQGQSDYRDFLKLINNMTTQTPKKALHNSFLMPSQAEFNPPTAGNSLQSTYRQATSAIVDPQTSKSGSYPEPVPRQRQEGGSNHQPSASSGSAGGEFILKNAQTPSKRNQQLSNLHEENASAMQSGNPMFFKQRTYQMMAGQANSATTQIKPGTSMTFMRRNVKK